MMCKSKCGDRLSDGKARHRHRRSRVTYVRRKTRDREER